MTPAERTVADLARAHPYFEDICDSHSFAEGIVLPHVFFAMVLNEVVSGYRNPVPAFDRNELFAFLERCLKDGDSEVVEVVTTSFVDGLPWPGQENSGIADELPPLLAREYDRSHVQGLDRG